jgi:hypothetical protein
MMQVFTVFGSEVSRWLQNVAVQQKHTSFKFVSSQKLTYEVNKYDCDYAEVSCFAISGFSKH